MADTVRFARRLRSLDIKTRLEKRECGLGLPLRSLFGSPPIAVQADLILAVQRPQLDAIALSGLAMTPGVI